MGQTSRLGEPVSDWVLASPWPCVAGLTQTLAAAMPSVELSLAWEAVLLGTPGLCTHQKPLSPFVAFVEAVKGLYFEKLCCGETR